MTDKTPPEAAQDLFRGLFWPQALMESAGRTQAAAAAEALRKVNAPVMAALEHQREAAEALGRLAEQMAAMAEHMARIARQQEELTRQLQAAMRPYQSYLDWLERTGKGRRTWLSSSAPKAPGPRRRPKDQAPVVAQFPVCGS